MSIGTKNRLQRIGTVCRDHLRQTHADSDEATLVEEFIAEIQSTDDETPWAQFTDAKRSDGEMIDRVEAAFQKWLNGE